MFSFCVVLLCHFCHFVTLCLSFVVFSFGHSSSQVYWWVWDWATFTVWLFIIHSSSVHWGSQKKSIRSFDSHCGFWTLIIMTYYTMRFLLIVLINTQSLLNFNSEPFTYSTLNIFISFERNFISWKDCICVDVYWSIYFFNVNICNVETFQLILPVIKPKLIFSKTCAFL